jgi:pyruvate carboxylase subunit B
VELIVRHDGSVHRVSVERRSDRLEVGLGERTFSVDRVATDGLGRSLLIDGRQYEVTVSADGAGRYRVSGALGTEDVEVLDPLTYLAEESRGGSGARKGQRVTAYMPGRVVALLVAEGDQVTAGQGLVVLEAMKMENEIGAEAAGTVKRVFVEPGQAVEGGDPLFEIE